MLVALILQGITGKFIGPAIAAVSLDLVPTRDLPERLGRNQRFRSAGSLAAAGLIGVVGYVFSDRFIFIFVALLMVPGGL